MSSIPQSKKTSFSNHFHALYKKLLQFFKTDAGFVLATFLFWRIALALVAYFAASNFIHPTGQQEVEFTFGRYWDIWAKWDGWHYVRNAVYGYRDFDPYTVFFPLYSLLIYILQKIPFINPVAAGLIISNLSLIGTGYFMVKLFKLDFSEKVARSSFVMLLAFPASIFLAAVYTESLFILLTVSSFYYARKNKWLPVFCLSFLAALTRNLGVFMFIPLSYMYFKQNGLKKGILLTSGSGFGMLSYMTYLYLKFENPIRFVTDQDAFGREIEVNIFKAYFDNFRIFLSLDYISIRFFEFGSVTLAIFVIIYAYLKKLLKLEYIIWMILILLPPIMQNVWASTNRYVMALFPIFVIMAKFLEDKRRLRELVLIASSMFLAYQTSLFVNYMWAG